MAYREILRHFQEEWPEVQEKAVRLLQQLIRIDTQNFEDEGTEIRAVRLVAEEFDRVGIKYEIIEPREGRGNIVARISGDGSLDVGALCLSAHLDTVPAPIENWEAEGWKHSPYGGHIDREDGCLYGRGAIDMKNMAAMCVTLLCFIKEKGITLGRDLIFTGLADEERNNSQYGIKYLVENRPELVEADVVLTELGGIIVDIVGQQCVTVMVGEKGAASLRVSARGPGGHGSIYHKDNPIARIGAAADVLSQTRLPLRVGPAGRATIESTASAVGGVKGMVLRQLLSPYFSDYVANYVLTSEQANALLPTLHNVANPVMVEGGKSRNQIPTVASMIVDCRLLPGCTVDDAMDDICSVLGPDKFKPRTNAEGEEIPPELELEGLTCRTCYVQDPSLPEVKQVLNIVEEVVSERIKGVKVITNLLPGGTDLKFFAEHPRKTPVCLGFTPMKLSPDLKITTLFHGVNERIPVEGFKWGLDVLADVVTELCGARLP